MESPSSLKKKLRTRYQNILSRIPPERRLAATQMARSFLPLWLIDRAKKEPFHVAAFTPFKGEIDIWPLLKLWMSTKQLILPRVSGNDLVFHYVEQIDDLSPSIFGFLEPSPNLPQAELEDISLIFVPGLAFDASFHRLGRGLGFYDKLLPNLSPDTPRVGLGFHEQLTETPLPSEEHDFPLTERLLF